jgi:ribosomal protein L22
MYVMTLSTRPFILKSTLGRACIQSRRFGSSPSLYAPKIQSQSPTTKQSQPSTKHAKPSTNSDRSSEESQKSKEEENPLLKHARESLTTRGYEQTQGSLGDSSVFDTDISYDIDAEKMKIRRGAPKKDNDWVPSKRVEEFDKKYQRYALTERDPSQFFAVVDPSPLDRANFERDKIINHIRSDWKISKDDYLKRTERSIVVKSLDLKTSRKKLGKLARQIAGKTIDEALLQMRFSKKRVAGEVIKHLEHAKNLAIVERGMGLGKPEQREGQQIRIRLKDGTYKNVMDRTELYIDQAWVGRGDYEKEPDYRARGRMYMMKKVYTSESSNLCSY